MLMRSWVSSCTVSMCVGGAMSFLIPLLSRQIPRNAATRPIEMVTSENLGSDPLPKFNQTHEVTLSGRGGMTEYDSDGRR